MEAREVFGSSPVGPDSVEIIATKGEWLDLLIDVVHMREQIHYYRSMSMVPDDGEYDYELATSDFITEMANLGVTY